MDIQQKILLSELREHYHDFKNAYIALTNDKHLEHLKAYVFKLAYGYPMPDYPLIQRYPKMRSVFQSIWLGDMNESA